MLFILMIERARKMCLCLGSLPHIPWNTWQTLRNTLADLPAGSHPLRLGEHTASSLGGSMLVASTRDWRTLGDIAYLCTQHATCNMHMCLCVLVTEGASRGPWSSSRWEGTDLLSVCLRDICFGLCCAHHILCRKVRGGR